MNLRFEEDLRIRFSKNDIEQIKQTGLLHKKFQLNNIFDFQIQINLSDLSSQVTFLSQNLKIQISKNDLNNILTEEYKKEGIWIEDINIQADILKR